MPRSRLLAFATAAVLVMASIAPGASPRAAVAAGDCTSDATLDIEERAFLARINEYRAQNGLVPLTASYTLTRAAAWKSADLGTNAYFAHDDLTRTWIQRIRDCAYGYNTYIGENIAAGAASAQQVFGMWKNSAGHNANMLGANYRTIGIGRHYVPGSPYGWYWTTEFGGYDDGWASATTGEQPAPIMAAPSPGDRSHRFQQWRKWRGNARGRAAPSSSIATAP
ncbi:MAG: CAP domain-containing protein [Chloroflexi bacterium]|nr:CAP domain-containing protein [Chloroflexota bacterium]